MSKFVIQYTPTGDLLDIEGYLASPDWVDKEVMVFESLSDAEDFIRDDLTGLGHEIIEFSGF